MKPSDAVICVRGLEKWYGDAQVLSDVSFDVGSGQIVGLLGPNGSGKSTAFRIIAGLLPFNRGRVTLGGFDVRANRTEAVRRMGYMPENPPFYPELSVRGHLRFWAGLRDLRGRELTRCVEDTMRATGLRDKEDMAARKLSKGYRQRLGLAQAILHDPSVLILDEPTAGLDPDHAVETRELIKSLGQSKTLLVSTHILPDVARMCDRVVIINEGRIVAEDVISDSIDSLERLYLDAVHGEQAIRQRGNSDE